MWSLCKENPMDMRYWQGCFLLKTLKENLFHAFSTFEKQNQFVKKKKNQSYFYILIKNIIYAPSVTQHMNLVAYTSTRHFLQVRCILLFPHSCGEEVADTWLIPSKRDNMVYFLGIWWLWFQSRSMLWTFKGKKIDL